MTKFFKWLLFILVFIVLLLVVVLLYLQHPMFGANPSWDRLTRINNSPHYHDGQFWNISETPLMTYDENRDDTSIFSWLWKDNNKNLIPNEDIPSIKTDLKALQKDKDVLVWLGHSAYYMILDWKTYLVDPTLVTASPVWFINKPFSWSNIYRPEDIPEIDYLIISHDHYDHLDYYTMKKIKNKVWKIIVPLWVWAHFEKRWFASKNIIELDWNEDSDLENNIKITCLPARHYSWRLKQNKTLRASFMLESLTKTIYIWWDSWYDKFFKEIWEKWNIDLAILENWQYDKQWRLIHMLPDDIIQAIKDLWAKKFFTVHNSKYAMANHSRNEPMVELDKRFQTEWIDSWIAPMIWEIVDLDFKKEQTFVKWRTLEKSPLYEREINEEIVQNDLVSNDIDMNEIWKKYFIADKILNNWISMPSLWLWTRTLSNEDAENAVYEAIKDGYRLIDTAQYYWNEIWVWRWVRKAISDGIIKREDVFITSKIYASSNHNDSIDKSLNNLDIGYIDLLLIHQPWFDDKWLYQTMEKYYKEWKIKSLWISNYYTKESVDEVLSYAEILPVVIQNENHIYYQNNELQDYVNQFWIIIESRYPFWWRGHTSENFNNETIMELAEKYNKTSAQIILRWQLQAWYIAIPWSNNSEHIAENYNIFDFELSNEDMNKIKNINKNKRYENW